MGGVCTAHGEIRQILPESLKERDHSDDIGIDGRIILERNLEK
jgi:hypothetical protein